MCRVGVLLASLAFALPAYAGANQTSTQGRNMKNAKLVRRLGALCLCAALCGGAGAYAADTSAASPAAAPAAKSANGPAKAAPRHARGHQSATASKKAGQGRAAVAQQGPVNINSADAQTIASGLTGIGLAKAQTIVDYRDAHGPFASAEKLTDIKGIGKSTVAKNRARIVLK